MKKVFYSFAIATMMVSLMACGGKTEQNTEGQDSTAVEAEAADAQVEEFKLNEIMHNPAVMDNNKYFTITYYGGNGCGNLIKWDIETGVYGDVFPFKEDGTRDTALNATCRVDVKNATLDDVKNDPKKWTLEEMAEDLGTTTINGVDYWTFKGNANMIFFVANTLSDNKVVIASIPAYGYEKNYEYLMKTVESLKLK